MYQLTQFASITRLSDGASIPPDPANRDYAEYLAWITAGNTPEPIPVVFPTPAELIAKAWATADALCRAAADDNSRARYLAWLIDSTTSEAKRSKIIAVQAWMDSVWMAYATYRANPAGEFVPPINPCPFTFWQIASA